MVLCSPLRVTFTRMPLSFIILQRVEKPFDKAHHLDRMDLRLLRGKVHEYLGNKLHISMK